MTTDTGRGRISAMMTTKKERLSGLSAERALLAIIVGLLGAGQVAGWHWVTMVETALRDVGTKLEKLAENLAATNEHVAILKLGQENITKEVQRNREEAIRRDDEILHTAQKGPGSEDF